MRLLEPKIMPEFFHRNYLWVCGVVCGIIFYQDLAAYNAAMILLLVLAAVLTLYRHWRSLSILLMALMLGYLASAVNFYLQPEAVLNTHLHDHKVLITDGGALGESRQDDDQQPYRVMAQTLIGGQTVNVQLLFPRDLPNPGLAEGEAWRISGDFYQPEPVGEFFMSDADGSWQDVSKDIAQDSFQKYLQLYGIAGIVRVKSLERETHSDSLLYKFKRACAVRLDRDIDSAEHRAMLSAITLGLRSRLPSSIKRQFAAVGAAHLFSVSGLHVGVLAFLLLLALRPLPAVWHWLICSTLFFYVLLTGGNAPAVRAFFMLWLIEFFKSRLLYMPIKQLLSLIAAGILLLEPDYLCDGGFQYSFIITFMLLAAGGPARKIMRSAAGAGYWWGEMPRWKKFLLKMRGSLCAALFFAGVAAAASAPLMLLHQDMFFAGSMLVNLLILPILTPLFAAALGKCLLPWGDRLWNFCIENILDYLSWVINNAYEFSSRSSWSHPHWITAGVFLTLLMLLIVYFERKAALFLLAGLFAVTAFQVFCTPQKTLRTAVVITGGNIGHPVAAIMLPEAKSMSLLNCSYDAVNLLDQTAYFYGVTHIDRLDVGALKVDCIDGINSLQNRFQVSKFRRVSGRIRSKSFRKYAGNIVWQTGAADNTLSQDGRSVELKIIPQANGSWNAVYLNKVYSLKRTSRPRVYIMPEDRAE